MALKDVTSTRTESLPLPTSLFYFSFLTAPTGSLTAGGKLRARWVFRVSHALHPHDGVGMLRPQVLTRSAGGCLTPGGFGLEHRPRGSHGAHGSRLLCRPAGFLVQSPEKRPEVGTNDQHIRISIVVGNEQGQDRARMYAVIPLGLGEGLHDCLGWWGVTKTGLG